MEMASTVVRINTNHLIYFEIRKARKFNIFGTSTQNTGTCLSAPPPSAMPNRNCHLRRAAPPASRHFYFQMFECFHFRSRTQHELSLVKPIREGSVSLSVSCSSHRLISTRLRARGEDFSASGLSVQTFESKANI